MSSYLPGFGGGGGLVRPLGRGIQNRPPTAASEVSFDSSSLSYGTAASRSGRFDDVPVPPVGRGLPVGRAEYMMSQTAGIGNIFCFASRMA